MNKQTGHAFCLFMIFILITFLFAGCSTLEFVADGNTPFKISPEKNSDKTVVVEDSADFFFWGESPKETNGVMKINLEDIESKIGMTKPSFVSLEQSFSFKSLFFTLVTFGLYCPVDYKVNMLKVSESPK